MRELLAVRITVGLVIGAAGCSLLVDASDPQCESNAECVAAELGDRCVNRVCTGRVPERCTGDDCDAATDLPAGSCLRDTQCEDDDAPRCLGGTCVAVELAERWLCPEREKPDESAVVRYSFQVLEYVARKAPANIVARACRTNDVECNNPVAEFKDATGEGLVEFELPAGFSGYFEVKSDALTALSYLTKPVTHDLRDRDLQVSARSTVELLATRDGTVFEPDKGVALVEAFDCTDTPSGGVHFEESKGVGKPFYIVDSTPSSDATVSVLDEINNVADGGFINVPAGFVTFTARWGVDGPILGKFNAQIRESTITFVDMYF